MTHIRQKITQFQMLSGNSANIDFGDFFSKNMNAATMSDSCGVLHAALLDTKLGSMVAIADEHSLYRLDFFDMDGLKNSVRQLAQKLKVVIVPGETAIIKSITSEILDYFNGKLKYFNTPLRMNGTVFQKNVWKALIKIPLGETRSYLQVAKSIHAPSSCRAVANANGANPLAIIVPCHRVINANGKLGGYSSGVPKKQWLLDHEKNLGHHM